MLAPSEQQGAGQDLCQGAATPVALHPSWRWDAWKQRAFLNAEGTGMCKRKFTSFCCRGSQSRPSFEGERFLLVILCLLFSSADPDSQLYDMGYTPEEEAPACPDEFDDFVTFEASMSAVTSGKHRLYTA